MPAPSLAEAEVADVELCREFGALLAKKFTPDQALRECIVDQITRPPDPYPPRRSRPSGRCVVKPSIQSRRGCDTCTVNLHYMLHHAVSHCIYIMFRNKMCCT